VSDPLPQQDGDDKQHLMPAVHVELSQG